MLDIEPGGLSGGVILLQTGAMAPQLGLELILLAISFLGIVFFTSAEAALIAVNKLRIRYLADNGNAAAQAVDRVLQQHEKFFATILLSQNAFTIFATAIGTAMVSELLHGSAYAALITTVALTIIISIFGEITPKTLAATYSERWSLIAGRPVGWVMTLCTPFIYLFTVAPRLIYKILGTTSDSWQTTFSEGELRMMIDLSEKQGAVQSEDADRLNRVFHFRNRRLGEIMTPRNEIVWIEKGTTLTQFLAIYAEHSHTRFPVFEGSHETVLGALSNKEVLIAQGRQAISAEDPVTDTMRPVDFMPETVKVADAFDRMQDKRLSMLLVTNEYGGIAGLVTLKQLTAVIIGTMVDDDPPSEEASGSVKKLTPGAYLVEGSVNIIEVNDRLDDLAEPGEAKPVVPEGEYRTVAGLVLARLGEIPVAGAVVESQGLKITVTKVDGARIEEVLLEWAPQATEGAEQ